MRNSAHCPTQLGHVTAPNGRPVAENFRNWFRNSKVVDSAGRPLVVFHGTAVDFQAFDKQCVGDNFRSDDRGFFFSSDPRTAGFYAESDTIGLHKRLGCHVMPAYVALQRPLVVDDALLRAEGMTVLGVNDDCVSFWDTYQGLVLKWVQARKADGVILVDSKTRIAGVNAATSDEPTRMVVAFEPHQVKSALGNSGLYASFSNHLSDVSPGPTALPSANPVSAAASVVAPTSNTLERRRKVSP